MKIYTFSEYIEINGKEVDGEFFEFYDKRHAKKAALNLAKKLNKYVFVTCQNNRRSLTFYRAYPDGSFVCTEKNVTYNN